MDNENNAVNEEMLSETDDEKPVELTELFVQKKKKVTLSDTITLQSIICVAISIVYIVINMFLPQTAAQMYDTYYNNMNSDAEENPIAEVWNSVADFMNSKPVEYD